jgi:hypothetical protein
MFIFMFPPLHGGNMMSLSLFKSCSQSAYVRGSADFAIFQCRREMSASSSYGSIIPAIDANSNKEAWAYRLCAVNVWQGVASPAKHPPCE